MAPVASATPRTGEANFNFILRVFFSFLLIAILEASSDILDAFNQFINATTEAASKNCTTFEEQNSDEDTAATLVILPKEIIVVLIMLTLWIYSIILTVRAWKQFLKD